MALLRQKAIHPALATRAKRNCQRRKEETPKKRVGSKCGAGQEPGSKSKLSRDSPPRSLVASPQFPHQPQAQTILPDSHLMADGVLSAHLLDNAGMHVAAQSTHPMQPIMGQRALQIAAIWATPRVFAA